MNDLTLSQCVWKKSCKQQCKMHRRGKTQLCLEVEKRKTVGREELSWL